MNEYELRRQERIDRLRERADKARRESESLGNSARQMADCIPFGQPILVGHHSEKRDRGYRARIQSRFERSFERGKDAAELERRAAAAEDNTAISSDDPEAVTKLLEKIAEAEKKQAQYVGINKALRKRDDEALRAMGLSDGTIAKLKEPDVCGDSGIPSYRLNNNRANIRRMKERVEALRREADQREAAPVADVQVGAVTIRENADLNRLQLLFPGKPSEEIRSMLKSFGFRWSPMEGAWQRQLNNAARSAARTVAERVPRSEPRRRSSPAGA